MKKIIATAKKFQESEITEYYVYHKLAAREKDLHNKKVLKQIAEDGKKTLQIPGRY